MNHPERAALFSGIGRMVVLAGDLDAALTFYRDELALVGRQSGSQRTSTGTFSLSRS